MYDFDVRLSGLIDGFYFSNKEAGLSSGISSAWNKLRDFSEASMYPESEKALVRVGWPLGNLLQKADGNMRLSKLMNKKITVPFANYFKGKI